MWRVTNTTKTTPEQSIKVLFFGTIKKQAKLAFRFREGKKNKEPIEEEEVRNPHLRHAVSGRLAAQRRTDRVGATKQQQLRRLLAQAVCDAGGRSVKSRSQRLWPPRCVPLHATTREEKSGKWNSRVGGATKYQQPRRRLA